MSSSSLSQRPTLIRLTRYDTPDADQFVLLHATPTSAVHPLNLKLYATEGERAFATDITQSKIYELRAGSYTGTSEDLEKIFLALLLKQDTGIERGVELAAAVDAKGVTLTVRQDIGGIKQRIAALQIPEEEVEIPIFDWAVEACGNLSSGSTQLGDLQSKVKSQEKEIEALTKQLKDLAVFKKEHEEMLLVKFSELLNSKKAKIRELSRELEIRGGDTVSSKAESPIVENESEVAEPAPIRGRGTRGRARGRAKAAAPRKRKPIAPPTDSESDAFVKIETDNKGKPSPDDETEDSEEAGPSRGYLWQEARSDRSVTEDEDELPPVRRPIAFTIKKPDPESEGTPDEDVEMDEPPQAQPAKTGGRARGGNGKGKAPASLPISRGKSRATRSKPKEPSPSLPSSAASYNYNEMGDSEDDEL
ncbi:hypothetical protein B9Z19DRAFT_1088186 [Tuber borchii]|uniref:Uncharacterized protein n=1 Tax=Tuber borchii TaxID=42251 RepID=A0A2T6ZLW1_TUBBO|nr:hypothetical protein B9Z19DRAFT_1088186 [Tuber borchii]